MFAQTTQATEFILDCLSTLLKISLNSSMSRQVRVVQYFQKTQANPFFPRHTHMLLTVNSCHAHTSRHVTIVTTRTMDSKHFVVMKMFFIGISMPEHIYFLAANLFTRRNLNQKFDPDFNFLTLSSPVMPCDVILFICP
jgi:hypothetical protein